MIALALSVGLLSASEPALPAWAHLVPALSLGVDDAPAPAWSPSAAAQPDLEPSLALAPPPVAVTVGGVIASSASMLGADLVIGGALVLCFAQGIRASTWGDGSAAVGWWVAVVPLSVAAALVPPWFAVLGAEGGLGKGGDRGAAYARTLAIRLAGLLASAVFPPAFIITELIAAPWVATWSVARSATERDAERFERARAPASFARPEADPARLR